ncbi:MAG TPA: hypothetical protein PKO44_07105 [Candidatus Omnitrophota bacterium]|nr:hypothetical protein [Candidatus Omnitrophota bacterium]
MLKKKVFQAQSLGEYTVLLSLVVLAIMAMTYFIQRGFQARVQDTRQYMMSELGPEIRSIHKARTGQDYNGTMEYEPYYVNRTADAANDGQVTILINGPAGTYVSEEQKLMNIRSVSRETPAQDL